MFFCFLLSVSLASTYIRLDSNDIAVIAEVGKCLFDDGDYYQFTISQDRYSNTITVDYKKSADKTCTKFMTVRTLQDDEYTIVGDIPDYVATHSNTGNTNSCPVLIEGAEYLKYIYPNGCIIDSESTSHLYTITYPKLYKRSFSNTLCSSFSVAYTEEEIGEVNTCDTNGVYIQTFFISVLESKYVAKNVGLLKSVFEYSKCYRYDGWYIKYEKSANGIKRYMSQNSCSNWEEDTTSQEVLQTLKELPPYVVIRRVYDEGSQCVISDIKGEAYMELYPKTCVKNKFGGSDRYMVFSNRLIKFSYNNINCTSLLDDNTRIPLRKCRTEGQNSVIYDTTFDKFEETKYVKKDNTVYFSTIFEFGKCLKDNNTYYKFEKNGTQIIAFTSSTSCDTLKVASDSVLSGKVSAIISLPEHAAIMYNYGSLVNCSSENIDMATQYVFDKCFEEDGKYYKVQVGISELAKREYDNSACYGKSNTVWFIYMDKCTTNNKDNVRITRHEIPVESAKYLLYTEEGYPGTFYLEFDRCTFLRKEGFDTFKLTKKDGNVVFKKGSTCSDIDKNGLEWYAQPYLIAESIPSDY
ncbi:hypothetical protein EIN_477190, partial [Entamoeba invadens IP1]